MSRPIKFRYANEIAGAFVMVALATFIGAVIVAGRSQGWFEGRFDLLIDFDTAEGSFGLQEGGEVWVMNTVAGRVNKIVPMGEGGMRGRLVLRNRFLPLIREDAVARVKRKFGLAGDAYVEIEPGQGAGIVDGATIPGLKDEEIMDTVQKILRDLEEDMLPMVEDSRAILANLNTITAGIAEGEGLAGAAISDKEMANEVKDMLKGANALIEDSGEAIRETTRLIQGAQKHWLIRKYIKNPVPDLVLSVSQIDASRRDRYVREWTEGAEAGRIGNSPAHIAVNALNMGYACLQAHDWAACERWLAEARFELDAAGLGQTRAVLLEAELAMARSDHARALEILSAAERPSWGDPREERAAWALVEGRAQVAAGRTARAQELARSAARDARRADSLCLEAEAAVLEGDIALAQERPHDARRAFDRAADLYRDAALFGAMCRRLAQAGALLEAEGEEAAAFDRYFRAVRSRFVSGDDYADYLAAARRVGRQAELQALLEPFTEGPEAPAPL